MRIKLLSLDIDDTLVYDVDQLSGKNRAAIRAAQKKGVYVTLATGRGYLASRPIARELAIDGPIINYGGALVNNAATGESIFTSEVENDMLHELLDFAKKNSHYAHIYDGDTVVTREACMLAEQYTTKLRVPLRVEPKIDTMEFRAVPKLLYIVEPERVDDVIEAVSPMVNGRLKISKSAPGFVEFNHPQAHKGAALAWLAKTLGVEQSEVAAMGDNTLDLEMIEWAGLGVAVGNANQEIKGVAEVIAPACRDDGVAWFIERYIL